MAQTASTYERLSLISMAKDKSSNPCDYYLFGKQHKLSFRKNFTRKFEKLELIYSDVCGPMKVDSLGGNKYFVTFINDASRKTWTKDIGIPVAYKKSGIPVFSEISCHGGERETGNPLKRLRTDNGGEYISREFKEYFSKHGIRNEKTVTGTPQHNGVAERMNQTIVEKVWCMLKLAKLPKSF